MFSMLTRQRLFDAALAVAFVLTILKQGAA
jgi:hypothetical protein